MLQFTVVSIVRVIFFLCFMGNCLRPDFFSRTKIRKVFAETDAYRITDDNCAVGMSVDPFR